ncbi:FAD-dependent pyridine nucleotide-disulfide oxidoreductase [Knoellia sinensis KCTC 19936]|uniref:FAD-dependent pyridine nucleotide-disulfide oxidoreductase n=1 Tax=Knoellia sinensis KCTC 19936 TaxID=1385520 RepID=A0A0A0J589_9MICO|nr:NAD(P)-binding domain-containing protein [Knoellia sinensis]KGN30781.1 FAD-dependent pyridine nucleotide-disulfide oxidoreductase [Knoellia sinensis KCTC 19936]
MDVWDSIVIGAGQGGLAASYFLTQRKVTHLVLDGNPVAGGAWQHRWDSLTMHDVHGVADLPGETAPARSADRANVAVPNYFADYEARHQLPIVRPVVVEEVTSEGELLVVRASDGRAWRTRTLVNATGTWTRPNWPDYPGVDDFRGEQFHTATYPGREHLRGKRIIVVGAGASAVQFIGELAPIADVLWVTRRPPQWRTSDFGPQTGLEVVTEVEKRVVAGLPPISVVGATGLMLREQEQEAARLGAFEDPLPIFERIVEGGAQWSDGVVEEADVILWATGFRSAVDHLEPLGLRGPQGGIPLVRVEGNVQAATTAALDPRVHLIGYGPSASTIGASRAARRAAMEVAKKVASPFGTSRNVSVGGG